MARAGLDGHWSPGYVMLTLTEKADYNTVESKPAYALTDSCPNIQP